MFTWLHLVGCCGHAHLIPDPKQEQPTLSTADGDLPNELIQALTVQLLSHWTYASLTGLQATTRATEPAR
jgi:hypothetical protein